MNDDLPECTECRELAELLVDYLDGEETVEVRARIMVHLETCEECARLLWRVRQVVSYCRLETDCDMPGVVHRRLWEVLSREIRISRSGPET